MTVFAYKEWLQSTEERAPTPQREVRVTSRSLQGGLDLPLLVIYDHGDAGIFATTTFKTAVLKIVMGMVLTMV